MGQSTPTSAVGTSKATPVEVSLDKGKGILRSVPPKSSKEKQLILSHLQDSRQTGSLIFMDGGRSLNNSSHLNVSEMRLSTTGGPKGLVKSLSQAEIDDRRHEGLCFWCDSKYIEPEVTSPVISLHALHGSQEHNTMRLLAHIEQTEVIILVDFGSTHNFMDSKLVKHLNLPTKQTVALRVMVANGVSVVYLRSLQKCPVRNSRIDIHY
ncbi:hypothetical protein PVK06_030639 [Gossypium arboreum]|uniref:Uncharacterized protein n=1 Tax=Gossypium arboreum TaxID=29729 RepID=A0ABR0NPR5_GOSAR|nr:hypothetical protein PVK06_030639 [Gossypium arboreum]